MSTTSREISAMFESKTRPYNWTEAEERAMILRAQAHDEEAVSAVLAQYAETMKAGMALRLPDGGARSQEMDLEEARQSAVLGVLEAIAAYDPERNPRLAGLARQYVQDALISNLDYETSRGAVPKRTLTRFFGILREADGNVYEAAALAPHRSMTRETFFQVLSAVREVVMYDAPTGDDEGEDSTLSRLDASSVYGLARTDTEIVEDTLLVRAAFAAVDMQEAEVIRHSYGFHDYEAQSDAEVAHRLGLSRPKVQRVRAGGLAKMRVALGVA